MIDKFTNKPSGFGRNISSNGRYFNDLLYKDGQENGFYREISHTGTHWIG